MSRVDLNFHQQSTILEKAIRKVRTVIQKKHTGCTVYERGERERVVLYFSGCLSEMLYLHAPTLRMRIEACTVRMHGTPMPLLLHARRRIVSYLGLFPI